jgi:cytochrome c-type biogenesis protein
VSDPFLYLLAFAAGLVSFASPCVLPLLPGYLSFISGSSVGELQTAPVAQRGRVVLAAILFVLGFSLVFSLFGSAFGTFGGWLRDYRLLTQQLAGGGILLMGVFMTGLIKLPRLQREFRRLPAGGRSRALGAFPLGMAFAVGWTPCIGPILASIYMLAFNAPGKSASLLLLYSLGLGVPFILSAVFFARLTSTLNWFKRHGVLIHRVSGGILAAVGVLLLTNRWTPLMAPLQRYFQPPI